MWIALGILLGLLFLLLALILFDPIELCIDTRREDYHLRWSGLGSARLTGSLDDPVLRVWVLGWRRRFHLLDGAGGADEPGPEKKRKASKRRRPDWFDRRMMLRLLRTFRVRRFSLQLDTGDYAANALLHPLFGLLSRRGGQWRIVYGGPSELDLRVTNRGWDVLIAFLTGIFFTKKRVS